MVKINLLPDLKLEYLHSQQTKRAVIVGSALVSISGIALLILFFVYVQVIQPQHRANIQTDIDSAVSQMSQVPDGVKMVTTQGALEQLPALQDKKNITSRLFGYIKSFTPRTVSYTEVRLDLETNTLSFTGVTKDLKQANILANNIKSAELSYKQNDSQQKMKPFSKVVFTNLGRADSTNEKDLVSFQVDFQVDPIMFNQSLEDIKITVDAASKELLIPSNADPSFTTTVKPDSDEE